MRVIFFILLAIAVCWSCTPKQKEVQSIPKASTKAQQVIDSAIQVHGGALYEKSLVSFNFRNRRYEAARRGGKFQYKRQFQDSIGRFVEDVLSNDLFERKIDGELVDLPEERSFAFSNSVNSVIYFALLPYFLNDQAVQKTYLGSESIDSQPYEKIKITFRKEDGGKDFEDEFVYWFHQQNRTLDYLAYNYLTDGGGARFRSAYNERVIEGIRFADYINWKPSEKRRDIENFAQLYEQDALIELSKIETEQVQVKLLK